MQRILYVAFILETAVAVVVGEGGRHGRKLVGAVADVGRRAPVTVNRLRGLKRAPCVIGNHSNATGDRQNRMHTAHLLRRFGIKTVQPAANRRIGAGRGDHHTVHLHIDAIDLRARGFGHHICAFLRLGQIAPFRRVAQDDILHRLDLGGDAGKVDVFNLQPVRQHDTTIFGAQLIARQAGLFHRGLDQRLARDGTSHT